jgi:hypothetical protein
MALSITLIPGGLGRNNQASLDVLLGGTWPVDGNVRDARVALRILPWKKVTLSPRIRYTEVDDAGRRILFPTRWIKSAESADALKQQIVSAFSSWRSIQAHCVELPT